jgi:hypothetical protein
LRGREAGVLFYPFWGRRWREREKMLMKEVGFYGKDGIRSNGFGEQQKANRESVTRLARKGGRDVKGAKNGDSRTQNVHVAGIEG